MEKKILIVEDSQVLAMAYSLPFVRKGYRVEMAGDGRQALQLIRSFQPSVVLLDLVLPKVRGSVILEAIRSSAVTESLPVIVFTSSLLLPNEEVRMRRLANRFLHKAQTSPEQIVGIVEELLRPAPAAVANGAGSSAVAQSPEEKATPPEQLLQPPEPPESISPPQPQVELPAASQLKEEKPAELIQAPPPEMPSSLPSPVEPEALASPEPPPPAELPPPVVADANTLLQEIESHTRRLLTEQSEEAQGDLLEKIAERLRRLGEAMSDAGSRASAVLLRAFNGLVENLLENRKHRASSATRTLLQACRVLQQLFKQVAATNQSWEPTLSETLVVDDSVVSLKAVSRALEGVPLPCVLVSDPLEAARLVSSHPFDLVVLDVDMPQMTGTDLCKKLRSIPAHAKTPVIFLTSLNRFDIRVTTARAGGDDFVSKPFLAPELALKALTHIFRRHLDAARMGGKLNRGSNGS